MVKNKIALGSAQFGLQYGVANAIGHVSIDCVSQIISKARDEGIDTIDTAISYGSSESALGQAGVCGFKVITKLPPLPKSPVKIIEWVNTQVELSLGRLKIDKLDGVLLHRAEDITGAFSLEYQEALQILRRDNLCSAVGVSIYDPWELEKIWVNSNGWLPEIIQAPLNIFDQRLIDSGWLATLSKNGIRVQIRSVFLQGLLLLDVACRNSYFEPWSQNLDAWVQWCNNNSISRLSAALDFAASQEGVERIVVGVDSLRQLKEILSIEQSVEKRILSSFKIADAGLIDPRRWNLL
jgi:aryl-alcohol dehydrogenase-like predicted oxidoreductase